jgi:hypothetical protein
MSTQRRASSSPQAAMKRLGIRSRSNPATPSRRGTRSCWHSTGCTIRKGADGLVSLAPVTRCEPMYASMKLPRPVSTAPMAMTSLQKDPRSVGLVCPGTPSFRVVDVGSRATRRHSLSPVSILSGSAPLHPTLPQDPAVDCGWAERHDGKGNLHFKHAA